METSLVAGLDMILFNKRITKGLDMILFNKRITKALIRLRGCAGWFAPLLFAYPRRQGFSRESQILQFLNTCILGALAEMTIVSTRAREMDLSFF